MNPLRTACTVLAIAVAVPTHVARTPATPSAVLVATARGQRTVMVSAERGHPVIPTGPLAQVLPLSVEMAEGWATVRFAGQPFLFLLDAAVMIDDGSVIPLTGGAYAARDTLFLPLQWLTDYVPKRFREGYRYDPLAARFEEAGLTPVVRVPPATNPPNAFGLRRQHTVVIDAGHGGNDIGNVGLFLPRGVHEKHITLAIATAVKRELERRGVTVAMTRSGDNAVGLYDRGPMCAEACDLFVSIHVDALGRAPGYQQANGIHTYFLGEGLTAEARRVANMENDAIRYETGSRLAQGDPRLFILKDLQTNEFLRESAMLADLVQSTAAAVHPGRNRGVAQNRFVVLATATRPAILVETGYATNRGDGRFLSSRDGQQRLALAIAGGIVEYLKRYEQKTEVAR
ncbi:MAG TPA: N-acetylmuramoyl-L-alanine amidase [Gemmatimonadales bacterium]